MSYGYIILNLHNLLQLVQAVPKQSPESLLRPNCPAYFKKCNFSQVLPVTKLTEDEQMMKDSVAKLANQVIAPYVRKMDHQQYFEPEVIEALFSNGVWHWYDFFDIILSKFFFFI